MSKEEQKEERNYHIVPFGEGYQIAVRPYHRDRIRLVTTLIGIASVMIVAAVLLQDSNPDNPSPWKGFILAFVYLTGIPLFFGAFFAQNTSIYLLTPDYVFVRNSILFWKKVSLPADRMDSVQLVSKQTTNSTNDQVWYAVERTLRCNVKGKEKPIDFLLGEDKREEEKIDTDWADFGNVLTEHFHQVYEIPILPADEDPFIHKTIKEYEAHKLEKQTKALRSKPWRINADED